MARVKRTRRPGSTPVISNPEARTGLEKLLAPFRNFVSDVLAPDQEVLDYLLTAGLFVVTLVVPFLYSRMTTENFLTPKEFVGKMAMAFLGAVFVLRFVAYQRVELARTRLDLPMALFWGFCALSVLWNYNVPSAIRDLRGSFLILLMFPLIVNTVRRRWQLEGILWMAVLAGVATAGLGVLETYNLYYRLDPQQGWVFARDEIFSGRIDPTAFYLPLFPQLASPEASMGSVVSTFGNRNYLGTFVMFVAFVPLSFFFYYRNLLMKSVSIGVFGFLVYGMYITRCRAALVGLVIGFVFMVVLMFLLDRGWKLRKRPDTFLFLGAALVIALAGFVLSVKTLHSTSLLDKLKYTLTLDRTTSNTYERIWIWYATHRSYAGSPLRWLFGQGYGSYKHFFPLNKAEVFTDENKESFTAVTFRQAHNDWLQIISELGLVGLLLFLFLTHRFLSMIYQTCRDDIWTADSPGMDGDHVLLIGLGAAMVSQLAAAGPDFPFHRIETAFYAVVFLSLVPVIADSGFFRRFLPRERLPVPPQAALAIGLIGVFTGMLAIYHESSCWKADTLVRDADARIRQGASAEEVVMAKRKLQEAIEKDSLPGDPYLKLATILEMEGKADASFEAAQRAWKNINFNARSTYHSVVFRRMHILYHLVAPDKGRSSAAEANKFREEALREALYGQTLTCGDARSIYYFYIGRMAMDLGILDKAEWALERAIKFPAFAGQAKANLAVLKASLQKWQEALNVALDVNALVADSDPTILNIIGISASNLGQNATAESALRKAIDRNPGQPVYKRDLGVVLLRLQRFPEARELLEAANLGAGGNDRLKAETDGLLASMSLHEMALVEHHIKDQKIDYARQLLAHMSRAKVMDQALRARVQDLIVKYNQLPAEQPPVPNVAEMPPQPPSPATNAEALPQQAVAPADQPAASGASPAVTETASPEGTVEPSGAPEPLAASPTTP